MHGTCKYVVDVLNTLHWSDHEYTYYLLFGFGSVEIAQKDMCCVQVIDVNINPHAYSKFNSASNVQMCIVCSDHPFI